MSTQPKRDTSELLREEYPDLTPEEVGLIDEALTRYAALAARLYDSLVADPERYARWKALTEERARRTLEAKVDSPEHTTDK